MISANKLRELLLPFGELHSQPEDNWAGNVKLPGAIAQMYQTIGPKDINIPGYSCYFNIHSLSELWQYQEGYRWNSITNQISNDWPTTWIVIADSAADPFIASESSPTILYARHGTGSWEAHPVFDGVYEMLGAMAVTGLIIRSAGDDFTDENEAIKGQYVQTALADLQELLGTRRAAVKALEVLGWLGLMDWMKIKIGIW